MNEAVYCTFVARINSGFIKETSVYIQKCTSYAFDLFKLKLQITQVEEYFYCANYLVQQFKIYIVFVML